MPKQALIARMRDIFRVLTRHGFQHLVKKRYRDGSKIPTKLGRWTRLRLVLEDLGPTFVKFGQIMSNRVDLFPSELILELQQLQYSVKPFDNDLAVTLLEEAWGRPLDKVLSEWDPVPSASASISQVHKAKLLDGTWVAVKIQRPLARKTITEDIALMKSMARIFGALFLRTQTIDPMALIHEFEVSVMTELDFREELRTLLKFSTMLPKQGLLHAPSPFQELSNHNVLVMEWVSGTHPSTPEHLKSVGLSPKTFLEGIAESFRVQIFTHGFFHADPHPGNLMVTPTGGVYLLDAGMTGILYKKQRDALNELMIGMATGDRVLIVQNIWDLCTTVEETPPPAFENELGRTVETFLEIPLSQLDLIDFFTQVTDLFTHNRLTLPSQFFILVKTLVSLDGLARRFHPEFQLLEWLSRTLHQNFLSGFKPQEMALQTLGGTYEVFKLLRGLPYDLRGLLKTFRSGKLQISLNERNLEKTMRDLGRITNRLSASLIITGLILAGTVLFQNPIQPFFYGIPVFAAPLFGGAILMGIWLLWSIWRSKTL